MRIRPIRSEADYDEALQRVEALWGSTSGTPEGDELDVLVSLVEAYEREHYPIDLPTPIEAIKFRLEQQGKGYRSLIGVIGQRTRVYEVMRGARPLSLNMIRKLHGKLGIPADVLIQSPRPQRMRAKRVSEGRSRRNKRVSVKRGAYR
jgi:HTH-type transcriptional regulator / antitoxin HigA